MSDNHIWFFYVMQKLCDSIKSTEFRLQSVLLFLVMEVTSSKLEWFLSDMSLVHCTSLMWWSEVAQSCPTLCNPMDCSLPGFSIHGIFQARILEWVTISSSRGSSRPRDWTQVSHIEGRHFNLMFMKTQASTGIGSRWFSNKNHGQKEKINLIDTYR